VVTFGIDIDSSVADNFPASNTAAVTTSQSVLGTSFTDLTLVKRRVTLQYTQDDSTNNPVAGTSLTYTVSITNIGPSDAANVTISDTMPVSGTLAGGSDPSCSAIGRNVTCPVANSLPVNGSISVPIVVLVDQANRDGALITNTVRVTSTEYTSGPSVIITETVQKQVSLAVTKVPDLDPAIAGAPLTYTIYSLNSSPSQATSVKLTDTLPVSTTFVPAGSSTYCSLATGNTVACNVSTVDGNALVATTIIVIPNQAIVTGTVITNTVLVTAPEIPSLVSSQVVENVIRQVDFNIVKTDSMNGGNVSFGMPLTYTIGVTNAGPSLASSVIITDTLPPSQTFTIRSRTPIPPTMTGPNVGDTFAGGSTFTYTLPTMNSGGSAHITLSTTFSVTPTDSMILNLAGVKANETVSTTIGFALNFYQ
jgi:uncharacterized repeat protein (TIGR01451 family)